jgi:redox-sensitive bicupin YhaK (pirin superfamily)
MHFQLFPASERGKKDIGWLKSNFFFSFSDYYNPLKSAFGTLVSFNDDFVQAGKGFGTHPHQNMEIISIMLQGSMSHKDDMGYDNVVKEGSVQLMSAGSGLFHQEWNVGEEEVNFLQIWIQPKLQNIKPRYQFRHFPKEKRLNKLTTIVSNNEGLDHCWINQNAKISIGEFDVDTKLNYSFDKTNKAVFVFVIDGVLSINDQMMLNKRDAVGIWHTDSIVLDVKANTSFVIIETVINQK